MESSYTGVYVGPTSRMLAPIGFHDTLVSAGLLALVSFSLPGRETPESASGLDLIGLIKVAIRFGVLVWFGGLIFLQIIAQSQQHESATGESALRYFVSLKWTSAILVPWYCYAAWCFLTIIWSPVKSISAGQWLGLLALLFTSQIIYFRFREFKQTKQWMDTIPEFIARRWELILKQLVWILVLFSFAVLVVHLIAPSLSGLNRDIYFRGSDGFVQSTAAGATASLGLTLSAFSLCRTQHISKALLLVASLIHFPVLILSVSRAAIAMAALSLTLCAMFLLGSRVRGLLLTVAGISMLSIILIDPGADSFGEYLTRAVGYLQRGQTADQLQGVSGRSEMWEAVLKEYAKSPIIGHGFFITSETGKLEVWGTRENHDAHNIFLQVLVTSGLVGFVLFSWAMLSSFIATWKLMLESKVGSPRGDLGWLIVIFGLWYLGWGQGCASIVGPIRPESVLFFSLLGLLAAAVPAMRIGNAACEPIGRSGNSA